MAMSCENFRESERRRLSRRAVLVGGLAGAVWWASDRSALAQTAFGKNGNVVVVIFLRGGADGLSMVAPYAEDAYYRIRPTLAVPAPGKGSESLLKLDDLFGLNPAMSPLLPIFEDGELAIMHAVGSGDHTRSHFEATSLMERGAADERGTESSGWLARHLLSTGGAESPLRAVALTSTMPESLGGATQAIAIESLERYRLQVPKGDLERTQDALADLFAKGDDAFSQAGRDTLKVLDTLNDFDPEKYEPSHGATYPDSSIGQALKQVSFLVRAEVGLEVACLDAGGRGGWDTHVAQAPWLTGLLTDLGASLAAFRRDLDSEMRRVTVVVQTEFGRRAAENSGFGTDHGRASVMFAMGGGVHGGRVVADWPGLEKDQLTGPGDLQVTTDYRDVLAEMLQARLNSRPADVFPGHRPKPVGVFSA